LKDHEGKIDVAMEPDWPPIAFFREDGSFAGISSDYFKLIEQRLGFQFQMKQMKNWPDILEKARDKSVDVVMNVVKTPERSEYLNFTRSYLTIATVLITRKGFSDSLSLEKLDGLSLAVSADFQINDYLRDNYPELKPVKTTNTIEGLTRLSRGEFDVVIAELATASYIIEKKGIDNLRIAGVTGHEYRLCIGVRKDWPILVDILDKGLNLITEENESEIRNRWISLTEQKQQGLGVMELFCLILIISLLFIILIAIRVRLRRKGKEEIKIIGLKLKWLSLLLFLVSVIICLIIFSFILIDAPTKDPLTAIERDWLKANDGKIRFAECDDYPPFDLIDENNKYTGISADYLNLIEKKLGFRVNKVRVNSWDEILKKAQSGDIDVISSIQKNQSRSEFLLFTEPYIDVPSVIVSGKETAQTLTLDSMQGMKVAVVYQYAVEEYLKENFSYLDLQPYPDPLSALMSVAFKNAEALILDLPVASYYISKAGISNLRMAGETGYVENLRFAVRQDLPILRRILDKGLSLITVEEKDQILEKWIHLESAPPYKTIRFWRTAAIPILIIIFLFLSILVWNKSLKNMIREQTKALAQELEERKLIELKLSEAKKAAETANQTKNEFLANISHEIRNPLHAITGYSELLYADVSDETQKSHLEAIIVAGQNLMTLINDILDLTKLEASMTTLQPGPVSLRVIVGEIKQLFELQLLEKGIQLKVTIDDNLPDTLLLDEIRLRQMLLNLVGNAIKFTEEGYIHISVLQEPCKFASNALDLIISIKDTGIGIPPKKLETIFESFVQHKTKKNKELGGTGLGLAICKRLVEMMNGEISVESTVGVGSIFSVRLNEVEISSDKDGSLDVENGQLLEYRFQNARVLVVDNVKSSLLHLKEILTNAGLNTITTDNGHDALFLASRYQPELILINKRLPVMDSGEIIKHLRKDHKTSHIPIVGMGISQGFNEEELKKMGFSGYLRKPINVTQLYKVLSLHLKHEKGRAPVESNVLSETRELMKKLQESSTFIEAVTTDIMPHLRDLQQAIVAGYSLELGHKLLNLGEEYHVDMLREHGHRLIKLTNDFDIENLNKLIQKLLILFRELLPKERFDESNR